MYRYLVVELALSIFLQVIQYSVKLLLRRKQKATSPVSHCSLPDAISRVPVWILDSDEKMSLILRNILI